MSGVPPIASEVQAVKVEDNLYQVWVEYKGQTCSAKILTFKPTLFGWKAFVEIKTTDKDVLRDWVKGKDIWL